MQRGRSGKVPSNQQGPNHEYNVLKTTFLLSFSTVMSRLESNLASENPKHGYHLKAEEESITKRGIKFELSCPQNKEKCPSNVT